MIKKMRAVAIVDLEINGTYSTVSRIEKYFAEVIEKFSEKQKRYDPDYSVPDKDEDTVVVTQVQSGMQDRRGEKTGPIDAIVFRTARQVALADKMGSSKTIGRVHIPKLTNEQISKGFERHLIHCRERLRREGRPTFEIQDAVDKEYEALTTCTTTASKK